METPSFAIGQASSLPHSCGKLPILTSSMQCGLYGLQVSNVAVLRGNLQEGWSKGYVTNSAVLLHNHLLLCTPFA